MRIGIDARFFGPSMGTGIGRYSQRLIEELEQIDQHNEYLVFLRDENFDAYTPRNPRFTKVRAPWRWYTFAEQYYFPRAVRQAKVDFMHYLHFNVPLTAPKPYLVTIHDLILSKYPTPRASTLEPVWYWLKQAAYRMTISTAVRRAADVVTVTEFTKRDIVDHFRYPADRIRVTYEGFDAPPHSAKPVDVSSYGITGPYVIAVGNAYPHKNLERLVDAFMQLRQRGRREQLLLVGRNDFFYRRLQELIQRRGAEAYIRCTGFVDDQTLDALYRGAVAHIFPSLYEGFGLPGLEAMVRGIPVVASRASCLPEVFANAASYFNPEDPADIAAVLDRVLTDESLRASLITQGNARVQEFSWRRMAEQTLSVYNTMAS